MCACESSQQPTAGSSHVVPSHRTHFQLSWTVERQSISKQDLVARGPTLHTPETCGCRRIAARGAGSTGGQVRRLALSRLPWWLCMDVSEAASTTFVQCWWCAGSINCAGSYAKLTFLNNTRKLCDLRTVNFEVHVHRGLDGRSLYFVGRPSVLQLSGWRACKC